MNLGFFLCRKDGNRSFQTASKGYIGSVHATGQSTGLEEVLVQCREASEHAMDTTAPRAQALRDVLTEYRQAVEAISVGPVKSKSKSVREAARAFDDKLKEVKKILLHHTDKANNDLNSSLQSLRKSQGLVTIALFGQTRVGKSTTLEALTRGNGATIGVRKATHHDSGQGVFLAPGSKYIPHRGHAGHRGAQGRRARSSSICLR